MRVTYHPDFPKDIKRFEGQYREISERLARRFRAAVDDAIHHIKASPSSAGHFLNTGSHIVKEVRRRNLSSFPFFILYGVSGDMLIFRSLIASASDPLTWLRHFPATGASEPPNGGPTAAAASDPPR
jgi:hypothetical protein